jgi:hypothetical protein
MNARKAALAIIILLPLLGASPFVSAQTQSPSLNVVYNVSLDPSYKLYGYLTHHVDLRVNGTLQPSGTSQTITVVITFSFDGVTNLPKGANYTIASFTTVPAILESRLDVPIPPTVTTFGIDILGSIYGDFSFFYRNVADIPYVSVSANVPPYLPTSNYVLIPQYGNTQLFSISPSGVPDSSVNINGDSYTVLNPFLSPTSVSVQYQPVFRDYLIFLYLSAIGGAALLFPVLLRKRFSSNSFQNVRGIASKLFKVVNSLDWRKLFAAFMLTSLVMISVAFVFGPSPTPKVYLAATPDTSKVLAPYVTKAGYSYLTVGQAGDELDTMAQLGTYTAVIVADYPPPLISGLSSVLHVIAVRGYTIPQYVLDLHTLYPDTLTVISNPVELTGALSAIQPRANPLGLVVGQKMYAVALAFEGILSLVLPFIALAFLSRFLVESTGKILVGIGEAIGFSFFCFMFGQLVFMASSLYLGLPVALHAAISGNETAVGVFGFGGGTRPRELAGTLGILFGLVSGKSGKFKFDRLTFTALIGVALFLLVDPLRLGNSFYDSVLAQTTSISLGSGAQSVNQARSIVGSSMDFFGSGYNVSLTYFAQHGASLYYLAAIPLALYAKLRRSTATLLAVFASPVAGFGFVRIADMFPTKSIASVVPGVALGAVLVLLLLAVNRGEGALRKRILESIT